MSLYQRFLREDCLVTSNLRARFPTFNGLFPTWERAGALINTYWATKAIRASGLVPVALSIRIGEDAIAMGAASPYGLLEWYARRLNFRLNKDFSNRPYWLMLESTDRAKPVDPHFHGVIGVSQHEMSGGYQLLITDLLSTVGNFDKARAIKLVPLYDARHWSKYCLKSFPKTWADQDRHPIYMPRKLKASARDLYNAHRAQARLYIDLRGGRDKRLMSDSFWKPAAAPMAKQMIEATPEVADKAH